LAFTTVRSATGVDFIGTPGVDVGVIFDETGNVTLSGLGDGDVIQVINSTLIQRTTSINGGDGADQITFVNTSISNSSINGNKGDDTIVLSGSVANSFVGGGEGSDIISGGMQYLSSLIEGGAGSDTILVSNNLASSTISGGDGDDEIIIGSYLNGAATAFNGVATAETTAALINATINGGDGNDTIDFVDEGSLTLNNTSINGNAGNDEIYGMGLNVTLSGTNFIGGGAGDDTIDFDNTTTDNGAAGFAKGFDLTGGSGNDEITGSDDRDTIWGNADNDTIFGGTGTDTIYAGAGNDRIYAENDRIIGGLGADDYVFVPGGGNSIFFINAVGESAAATSGTARTFDSFVDYSGFVAGDSLNISAVTNQLAGGMYVGAGLAASSNLGAFGPFTDFAGLKAALDLPAVVAAASDTGTIRTYTFSATIAGTAGNYLWIQDSQRAFTSSDLLFQTKNIGSIPVDQIALV
jgi:Ca2+-binding RTX toxin-like protein